MNLSLRSISKSYHDGGGALSVLKDVSFEFVGGKSYAVMGRSGVGKSTLLHIIGGLDAPTAGEVWYGETNVSKLSTDEVARLRGREVGFVFQFHHLLPEFSAEENVAMPLLLQGRGESEALELARAMLRRVGLSGRDSHRPGALSGGEQQRVAVARALVGEPKLLLADEPTGNLDGATALEIQKLLVELPRKSGPTVIVVTHSRELAESLDCCVEMGAGGTLRSLVPGSC